MSEDFKCKDCNLWESCNKQCFPKGTTSPLIYFVGEAPGPDEDLYGIPFVGKSGQYLKSIAGSLGITEENSRYFNVVRCIPYNDDKSSFRGPSESEVNACIKYVSADILKTNPKIVVLLGGSSTWAFLREKFTTISSSRGVISSVTINDKTFKVLPTFHPSYLLRKSGDIDIVKNFLGDLKLAYEFATGKSDLSNNDQSSNYKFRASDMFDKDLRCATTYEEFKQFKDQYLDESNNSAYDIETNAISRFSQYARIAGMSFAPNNKIGIYVVRKCLEYSMPYDEWDKCKELAIRILGEKTIKVHNQMYELPYTLNEFGMEIPNVVDTLVKAKLMLGGNFGAGLKYQCQTNLGYPDWDADIGLYQTYWWGLLDGLRRTNKGNDRDETVRLRECMSIISLKEFIESYSNNEDTREWLEDKRISILLSSADSMIELLKAYYPKSDDLSVVDRALAVELLNLVDINYKEDRFSYEWIPLRMIAKYGAMDSVATQDLDDFYNYEMEKESKRLGIDLFKGYQYWMMRRDNEK